MTQDSIEAGAVTAGPKPGRGTTIALCVAIGFGAALLAAAFTVPVYTETSTTSDGGAVTTDTATIASENGIGVALALAIPLLISVLVAYLLTRSTWRRALLLAWIVTGILVALNMVAMMSIGLFVLPVTVSLAVACALRSR